MKKITIAILMLSPFLLSACWQVAAARAAKKRTSETGYVVGTIEQEAGIEDPLGRKQKTATTDESSEKK